MKTARGARRRPTDFVETTNTEKNYMPRSNKRKAVAIETHVSIAQQTAAFLKSGGNIQRIPTGLSGQPFRPGPKHLNLGNKAKRGSHHPPNGS